MGAQDKAFFRLEIKKSVFLSRAFRVEDESGVKRILSALRKRHPKCNHVVWAYVLGKNAQQVGFSDDGEPRGTAGRPCLRILKYSGRTNLLIAVIRYFGGTKLGTGGLQRAYTQCAQGILEALPQGEVDHFTRFKLGMVYSVHTAVRRLIDSHHGGVEKEDFQEHVELFCTVPEDHVSSFTMEFQNLTRGEGIIQPL